MKISNVEKHQAWQAIRVQLGLERSVCETLPIICPFFTVTTSKFNRDEQLIVSLDSTIRAIVSRHAIHSGHPTLIQSANKL